MFWNWFLFLEYFQAYSHKKIADCPSVRPLPLVTVLRVCVCSYVCVPGVSVYVCVLGGSERWFGKKSWTKLKQKQKKVRSLQRHEQKKDHSNKRLDSATDTIEKHNSNE